MTSILRGTLTALAFASTVWLTATPAVADDFETCARTSGDQAIAACTRAINSDRYDDGDLASLLNYLCFKLNGKRESDKAIEHCSEAIRLKPDYAAAFNNRGIAYDDKGQYDRAIEDYDRAIRLNSSNANPFNNRAAAYLAKGQYDRAMEDYDHAIRLDPNIACAFYNRGVLWERKNDLQRALADFKKAAELDLFDLDGPKAVERVTKALSGQ